MLNIIFSIFICMLSAYVHAGIFYEDIYNITLSSEASQGFPATKSLEEAYVTVASRAAGKKVNLADLGVTPKELKNLLSQYRYIEMEGQSFIQLSFQPEKIQEYLQQKNIGFLPERRPVTLLWLATQQEGRPAEIVTSKDNMSWADKIDDYSQQVLLPLVLPLYDLSEQQVIDAQTIDLVDWEKLANTKEKYQADYLLVAYLQEQGGLWSGHWHWLGPEQKHWNCGPQNKNSALQHGLVQLRDELLPSANEVVNSIDRVNVLISHIKNLEEYAQVLDYLKKLAGVKAVQVVGVDEETLDLQLTIRGGELALQPILKNCKKLKPMTLSLSDEHDLSYKWMA